MKLYRIRAYRRQLVEALIAAKDDEWAFDAAIDLKPHEWDVIKTLEVEEPDSITPEEPCPDDNAMWHRES